MALSIPGRFNRLFQKYLSTKGGALITDVSGEIIPVFPLFFGAENRYLEGWDRFAAQIQQPAVAAQNGEIQFRNPAGSNVVAVFESALSYGANSDLPQLTSAATNADLATVIALTANRLDARGRANPTLIGSRTTGAGLGTKLQGAYAANGFFQFIQTDIQEIPLLPGDALQFTCNVVNQVFNVAVMWRERAMEESELK